MRESLPKRVINFVVEELQNAELGMKVMQRPAKISLEKYRILAESGAIMVHYAGSRYTKTYGLGVPNQNREMLVDCVVVRKSLRPDSGEDEALDVLEQVCETLVGKKHQDCSGALYMDTDTFLASEENQGVLQYQARLVCPALMVSKVEDEEGLPLLQEVTSFNELNG
ncbi:Gp37 family protein [Prosthecochloris sp. SCSIO W1102]|uniref:Gp37 family protein n=1 Tax=Prosthecochloris sp. SCSIO W1102 TaxID=2992243 RepID=UPI00223E4025|nr:Gp37 family protein [Prosthecochloris sp. SCSIO W1102]UZJ39161.1 Gp37 family protein [Prosthecochloris sp. SCSIO W1102]